MSSRLSDRLVNARKQVFIGRTAERELFDVLLKQPALPVHILYIHGPGGVGKTTLLRELAERCTQAGVAALFFDARNIDPTPVGFNQALHAAAGAPPEQSSLDYLAGREAHTVVFIDTSELLVALDDWLRVEFLPQAPEHCLFVLAGRQPLSAAWRADPGWQREIKVLALRNLDLQESREYLSRRSVPAAQQTAVLDFTHGHPLALSLLAEVFAQRPNFEFVPADTPDIVSTLVEQFVQKVPGPAHRSALEACALVRVTTEPLLAAMLDNPDVHELFEWLRNLSFIELRRGGLFPHDLARDALAADLRWRNPDWYAELHRRARQYYIKRVGQTGGQEQQRVLWDYFFLHRESPVVRPMFDWQTGGGVLADALRPSDRDLALHMVERHEGAQSAALAARWLDLQPENAVVFRGAEGVLAGFYQTVVLDRAAPADLAADPGARAAWDYLQRKAPLRPGETAAMFRFWMDAAAYQAVSPSQSLIFVNVVRYYLTTPGLAFTFFPCADPDFWAAGFAYADLYRLPDADFSVEGRSYGVYGHDWRSSPPLAWLDLLAERETKMSTPSAPAPVRKETLIVLSQAEFEHAAREALRIYTHPNHLHGNPLLRSRLVTAEQGAADEAERIQRLRTLIQRAAESLLGSPRSEKLYRALDKTYFRPAPTQEAAAELLDVPFSTYRRHLKAGIEAVIEWLWQQEVGR